MSSHSLTKRAAHPLGSPLRWRARRLKPRVDFSSFSGMRQRHSAPLVDHRDFSLDQEHTILPVSRATPEFSAAHSDVGHRCRYCNLFVGHVLELACRKTEGALTRVEQSLAHSSIRIKNVSVNQDLSVFAKG